MLLVADALLDEVVPGARRAQEAVAVAAAVRLEQRDRAKVALDRGDEVPPLPQRVVPGAVLALGLVHHRGGREREVAEPRLAGEVVERPVRQRPVALALEEEVPPARGEERQVALPEAPHADVPAHALVLAREAAVVEVVGREPGVEPQCGLDEARRGGGIGGGGEGAQ